MATVTKYLFKVDSSGSVTAATTFVYDDALPIPWSPPEYNCEGTLDVYNAPHRATYNATTQTWSIAAIDPIVALQDAKSAKLAEFVAKRDAAILSEFRSDALVTGTMKTYAYDPVAQERFSKMLTRLVANTSITSVDWVTKEDGLVTHTRAQFIQLATVDAYNHESTPAYHFLKLEAQVSACATVDAVSAIVW